MIRPSRSVRATQAAGVLETCRQAYGRSSWPSVACKERRLLQATPSLRLSISDCLFHIHAHAVSVSAPACEVVTAGTH